MTPFELGFVFITTLLYGVYIAAVGVDCLRRKTVTGSPRRLRAMKECTCVSCGSCDGTGNVWFDFRGQYLGNHRCDDLDELEHCDECGGSGIGETCRHCLDERDMDEDYDAAQYAKEGAA